MRFLADMGIATSTVRALVAAGHDAVHLSALGLQRLADDQILVKARDEKRIVLTFDLDFADLLALGLLDSPSVVIFRLHDETPASVGPKLNQVIAERAAELEHGALIIIEDARYRMRHLPLKQQDSAQQDKRE